MLGRQHSQPLLMPEVTGSSPVSSTKEIVGALGQFSDSSVEITRANHRTGRVDRLPAWRYCSPQGPDRRGLRGAPPEVVPVPGGGSARGELLYRLVKPAPARPPLLAARLSPLGPP